VYRNRSDHDQDGIHRVALLQAAAKMTCYFCRQEGHLFRDCLKASGKEKKAIAEAIKARGYKGGKVEVKQGQSHLSVGSEELQECMDGVANVNINEDEASIGTLKGFVDAGQCEDGEEVDGVALIMPTSSSKRDFNCGRDMLWLDSGATKHTIFATEHLTNVYTSQVTLRQNCNAGYKLVNKKGFCLGFKFWASPDGIANLLSLTQLEETGHLVHYKTGGKMEVWTPDKQIIKFEKSAGVCRGMHYIDLSRPQDYIRAATSRDAFTFVETVRGRMEGFMADQVRRATDARDGLAMMGHPPQDKISRLVSNKSSIIQKVPFTVKDLSNSTALFGPDRGAIRGKTTR
jgi:hypothetical protein